jgi:hypothetical protein
MFIEIDGNRYPCEVEISKTQAGKSLVRVISDEAPIATNGFKIINGETEIDKSSYKYLYRSNDGIKEYTAESEEIIPAEGNQSGVPVNPIQQQISALNRRIADITPYTATKEAYYGETEKVFYDVPNGNVTIFCDVPNSYKRIENRLIVSFEKLTDTVEITVMVQ